MSEYLTLKQYIDSAKNAIKKYNSGVGLKNEDCISYVASCMMKADQVYDPTICGEKSSRDGFRMYYARFAVLKMRRIFFNKKNKKVKVINSSAYMDDNNSGSILDMLSSKIRFNKTDIIDIVDVAKTILNSRQYQCFYLHYICNETLQEIGNDLGITKQAVSMNVLNSVDKIKNYIKCK